MDRQINRIPRGIHTKFGGPSQTLKVNWDRFEKIDSRAALAEARGKKRGKVSR